MDTSTVPQPSSQMLTTPTDLLSLALQNHAAIDVIERLTALCREERDYRTRVAFDEALNRCQQTLRQISADATNPSTSSRYASYAKLDKAVRPIYTAEGFALSFGERDCPTPGKTRFVAYLSRAGETREYLKDMFPSTKGPQGKDVMTPIHADAAADSYAKRYLLKDIFNIAIGEGDNDGNPPTTAAPSPLTAPSPQPTSNARISKWAASIANAPDRHQLTQRFRTAYSEASAAQNRDAQHAYIQAKDARLRELSCRQQ